MRFRYLLGGEWMNILMGCIAVVHGKAVVLEVSQIPQGDAFWRRGIRAVGTSHRDRRGGISARSRQPIAPLLRRIIKPLT